MAADCIRPANPLRIQKRHGGYNPPPRPPEHLRILRQSGILLRGRGKLYSLNPIYLVPGKPGHVDLGSWLFRLDVLG